MKILHTTPLYFPTVGGVETLTRLIAEEMAREGHESHVFTANARHWEEFHRFNLQPGPFLKEESIQGVKVHRFALNPWFSAFYSQATYKIRGGYRLQHILGGRCLEYWQHGPVLNAFIQAIGRSRPDIILALNDYSWTTYAACVAKKRYKIPLVFIPSTHTANSWAYSDALKEVYKDMDCVVASTAFERDHLIKQGMAAGKIHVMSHPVDLNLLQGPKDNSFRPKYQLDNQPVILYLGRLTGQKGIEQLIKAMPLVWQHHPQAHLVLAGKEAYGDFNAKVLNPAIQALNPAFARQIIRIPDFEDGQLKYIYDAADIFVMPSNIDSFGLVYLEAWSRQLPVMACKNSPQESFIEHGKTGYLVEYGNVESTAQGLKYLLDHPEIRQAMGKNGYQQLLKEHKVETYGQRLLNIYQDLVRKII